MLKTVIDLYRKIGRPPLTENGSFCYEGMADTELLRLFNEVKKLPSNFGEMSYDRLSSSKLTFEFAIVSAGENGFFENFATLVQKTPSLGSGNHLNNFYIIDEDWTPADNTANDAHAQIIKVCELIKNLSKVAASEHPQNSFYNLVFSTPAALNKPPKTIVIQTRINDEVLSIDLNKTSLIKSLANAEHQGRLHLEERRAILNGAICECLDNIPEDQNSKFMHILKSWDVIIENYWKNFQIYIHSFSFEKTRKEFAQAELDYGTKLSAAFSDLAGKILALPVSLVALLVLDKATSKLEVVVAVTGLIITSIILLGILINQILNVQRFNNSLDASFENLTKTLSTYPKTLQRLILKSKANIHKQKMVVETTLYLFCALSLAPAIGAILIVYYKNQTIIHAWIEQHIPRC